jgi:hypothetical protein
VGLLARIMYESARRVVGRGGVQNVDRDIEGRCSMAQSDPLSAKHRVILHSSHSHNAREHTDRLTIRWPSWLTNLLSNVKEIIE